MKFFKKKTQKSKEITVELIKNDYPHIYKAIFDKGVAHVHQEGLYADDLKKYPGGEELADKVKNGEITIEEASLIAVKSIAAEKDKEKENKPNNVIGFRLRD